MWIKGLPTEGYSDRVIIAPFTLYLEFGGIYCPNLKIAEMTYFKYEGPDTAEKINALFPSLLEMNGTAQRYDIVLPESVIKTSITLPCWRSPDRKEYSFPCNINNLRHLEVIDPYYEEPHAGIFNIAAIRNVPLVSFSTNTETSNFALLSPTLQRLRIGGKCARVDIAELLHLRELRELSIWVRSEDDVKKITQFPRLEKVTLYTSVELSRAHRHYRDILQNIKDVTIEASCLY